MPVHLIREADVRALATMPLALEAVEAATRQQADATAINQSRRRLSPQHGTFLHYMAAADLVGDYLGMKIYTSGPQGTRFLVPLFRASTGEPLALIEADYLGQMRTGAASGLATKWLAQPEASSIGIVGTGRQARTQLEAICLVRKIRRIRVFGRDAARRAAVAEEMSRKLDIAVEPVQSAEEAVAKADIVVTATTAREPVVHGAWLQSGVHINAIGANMAQRRELDDEVIARASLIVTDSKEQAREEAGDLIQALGSEPEGWGRVFELPEVLSGKCLGRQSSSDITVFKSNGIAIWDVCLAGRIFELAVAQGIGNTVDFLHA